MWDSRPRLSSRATMNEQRATLDGRRRRARYTGRVSGQTKPKGALQEITTRSAEGTIAFGRTLAQLLTPPKLVLLRGDLGAGKTTLVKGIAAAFEAAAEEDVQSYLLPGVRISRTACQSLPHRSLPHRYAERIGDACSR